MDKAKVLQKLREMGLDKAASLVHDLVTLQERNEAKHRDRPDWKHAEPLNEREFVREFGSKVKHVRYSGRADFVGLMVRGDRLGFMVVQAKAGRRIRFLMKEDGRWHVTKRYINVNHDDSVSAMQRGLLRNVA